MPPCVFFGCPLSRSLGIQSPNVRWWFGVYFITSEKQGILASMKPFSGKVSQDPYRMYLGGGNSKIFYFHPTWGNDPIWLIFFKGVGSTTNQLQDVQIFRHLGNTAPYQVETLQRGDSFPRPMPGWPEEFVPGEQVGVFCWCPLVFCTKTKGWNQKIPGNGETSNHEFWF